MTNSRDASASKKYQTRYLKDFVSEKSFGFGIVQILGIVTHCSALDDDDGDDDEYDDYVGGDYDDCDADDAGDENGQVCLVYTTRSSCIIIVIIIKHC